MQYVSGKRCRTSGGEIAKAKQKRYDRRVEERSGKRDGGFAALRVGGRERERKRGGRRSRVSEFEGPRAAGSSLLRHPRQRRCLHKCVSTIRRCAPLGVRARARARLRDPGRKNRRTAAVFSMPYTPGTSTRNANLICVHQTSIRFGEGRRGARRRRRRGNVCPNFEMKGVNIFATNLAPLHPLRHARDFVIDPAARAPRESLLNASNIALTAASVCRAFTCRFALWDAKRVCRHYRVD